MCSAFKAKVPRYDACTCKNSPLFPREASERKQRLRVGQTHNNLYQDKRGTISESPREPNHTINKGRIPLQTNINLSRQKPFSRSASKIRPLPTQHDLRTLGPLLIFLLGRFVLNSNLDGLRVGVHLLSLRPQAQCAAAADIAGGRPVRAIWHLRRNAFFGGGME